MPRRRWQPVLLLYALAGAADAALHLSRAQWSADLAADAARLVVAFAAGLFWPIDLVAQYLLHR